MHTVFICHASCRRACKRHSNVRRRRQQQECYAARWDAHAEEASRHSAYAAWRGVVSRYCLHGMVRWSTPACARAERAKRRHATMFCSPLPLFLPSVFRPSSSRTCRQVVEAFTMRFVLASLKMPRVMPRKARLFSRFSFLLLFSSFFFFACWQFSSCPCRMQVCRQHGKVR